MTRKIKLEDVVARLDRGEIIPVSQNQWVALAAGFTTRDVIPTGMAGEILLVRRPVPGTSRLGWAIVEQPKPEEKVIRPLKNEKEARALIADRLAAYERMWDG
jgi:hypothetical protein